MERDAGDIQMSLYYFTDSFSKVIRVSSWGRGKVRWGVGWVLKVMVILFKQEHRRPGHVFHKHIKLAEKGILLITKNAKQCLSSSERIDYGECPPRALCWGGLGLP